MVLAAKIQVYATSILCLIWLAGFVLALVKFRVSPRASVLFIIALFFAALGQTLDVINLLTVNNMDQLISFFPGSLRTIRSILNYTPSIFSVLSWGLILFAFVTVMGKKKNES